MQNKSKEIRLIGRVMKGNGKEVLDAGLISCIGFTDDVIHFDRTCIYDDGKYSRFYDDDIVTFTPCTIEDRDGLWAAEIKPVITMRMVKDALRNKHLQVKKFYDKILDIDSYLVIDENNYIQSNEYGMSFDELAKYAGFKSKCKYVKKMEEQQDRRRDIVNKIYNDFDFKIPYSDWSYMLLNDIKAIYYDLLMQKQKTETIPG